MMSNLFFTASNGESPADLRKKFLDACKQNGQKWGLLVREMDNPVIASSSQDELSDSLAVLASGASERRPPAAAGLSRQRGRRTRGAGARRHAFRIDHPQLCARCWESAMTTRRFSYRAEPGCGNRRHRAGGLRIAEGGVPTDVIAPSLLFEEVEVHGPHGEPRRMPLVPPPPLQ